MQQFETVTAELAPRRRDDLAACMSEHVGRTFLWRAQSLIESGPDAGVWAMTPIGPEPLPAFGSVPACDLRISRAGR